MQKYTLEELNTIIREKNKLVNEKADLFTASLTPEQQALRREIHATREEHVDELAKLRDEMVLQATIDKAKNDDPVYKEIIKEVPVISFSGNYNYQDASNDKHHYLLPLVAKCLNARCHTWLVGPAGSGKTTLAASVAAELNLPFASQSVCSQTTKTDFLGYLDANGVYRSTSFRDIYENGGVFCLDEIDNGNANVLAVLNSALAGDSNSFPDKMVKRHPDFVVIACANTFGVGATSGYVGRVQIDASTLDRFFFIEMPYDEGLESRAIGIVNAASPSWKQGEEKIPSKGEWLTNVKRVRRAVDKLGIKAIVSPRATYMGVSLINQGVPLYYLQKGLLYKSLSKDVVNKINQS
jgi:cobaltochelatase CobS